MVLFKLTSLVPYGFYCIVFIFNSVVWSIVQDYLCWPYNLVPYSIGSVFTLYERNYIKQQIEKINEDTCILWVDIDITPGIQNVTNSVRFEKGVNKDCHTQYIHPVESILEVRITLSEVCFEGRSVLHEIVHALGFDHEHARIDRECYVLISEDVKNSDSYGIDPDFVIPNIDRFPYDKHSIMHYGRSSDLKALSERFYWWEPLGTKEPRLTELDLWKLQYRFCGWPHYCDVHPQHCRDMEREEAEKNCTVNISR